MDRAGLPADGLIRDGRIICIAKDTKQALPASNRLIKHSCSLARCIALQLLFVFTKLIT